MLCESGFWKSNEGGGGRHESVRIFIIARICNNEFISVISSCVSPGVGIYVTA